MGKELQLFQDAGDELVLVLSTCDHLTPHISTIVPHPLSTLCGFLDILSSFLCVVFHQYFLQGTRIAFGFFVAHHPKARQLFSAIFSHRKERPICTHLLVHIAGSCRPASHLFVFSLEMISSLFLFPIFQLSAVSTTNFRLQKRRRHTHGPPIADILLFTERAVGTF